MSPIIFTNGTCITDADCHHGQCLEDNTCFCNVNVLGENCEQTYEEAFGVGNFVAWRVVFTIIFAITSGIIVWKGYTIYKEGRGWTLKAVGHVFVFLLAFLRFLFFAMDPMCQRGDVPLLLMQLIFGYGFVADFTAFFIVLLYWAGAYHFSMKEKPKGFFFKRMRIIFYCLDGLWVAFEFVYRMMIGLNGFVLIGMDNYDLFDTVYNIYIALICLGLSGGFAIYGGLLIRTLTQAGKGVNVKLKKLTTAIIILSVTFFVTVLFLIAVILSGGLYSAEGAIGTYTVGYLLEVLLCFEMIYIMRAETPEEKSDSSQTGSTQMTSTTGASSSVSVASSNAESSSESV